MYLDVYQPRLQTDREMAAFSRLHRREIFASSALMNPMSKSFIAAVDRFVRREKIPLITFTQGQRKDDVTQEYRSRFSKSEEIVVVGKVQEKTLAFRTEKRRNPQTGRTYPWIVHPTAMVNYYYFCGIDKDFGPFFLKFCTYFPYNAKLCINGHEYVKWQLVNEQVAFEAPENGILKCAESPSTATTLRWPVSQEDQCPLTEMAGATAALFYLEGSRGWLPLQRIDPPGRVLLDPGPGSAANRPNFL